MPNKSEIEGIAKRLSRAQRAFVELLPSDGGWRETPSSELDKFGKNALRGFGREGLVEGYYRDPMRFRLTPLGLAVRASLQVQS